MLIGVGTVREFWFDVTDRIVTEVTDQAAMKLGQAIGLGNLEGIQVILDKKQRVVGLLVADNLSIDFE